MITFMVNTTTMSPSKAMLWACCHRSSAITITLSPNICQGINSSIVDIRDHRVLLQVAVFISTLRRWRGFPQGQSLDARKGMSIKHCLTISVYVMMLLMVVGIWTCMGCHGACWRPISRRTHWVHTICEFRVRYDVFNGVIKLTSVYCRYKFERLLSIQWVQLEREDKDQNDLWSVALPPKVCHNPLMNCHQLSNSSYWSTLLVITNVPFSRDCCCFGIASVSWNQWKRSLLWSSMLRGQILL